MKFTQELEVFTLRLYAPMRVYTFNKTEDGLVLMMVHQDMKQALDLPIEAELITKYNSFTIHDCEDVSWLTDLKEGEILNAEQLAMLKTWLEKQNLFN